MRPRIEGPIEDRINENMEDAGYDNPAEFIKYCVNKQLDIMERGE